MELPDTVEGCQCQLLCLHAIAVREPTTVSGICDYIEQLDSELESVDPERVKMAVSSLEEADLVRIALDPYRPYVVSLDSPVPGFSEP